MVKRSQKQQQDLVKRQKFQADRQVPQIHPKTENQRKFFNALNEKTLIVGRGSAGSGKSLISCYVAARELSLNHVKKIVLIRAYQPLAGRSTGFLPGSVEEKLYPYYAQMIEYLEDVLGKAAVEIALKHKTIEICPLETIRGRNWDDAYVVCDEAQNLYVAEIQAIVTRVGHNTKLVFVGDHTPIQNDVKKGENGLDYLVRILKKYNITDSEIITFGYDDILRSGITRDFVIAFDKETQEEERQQQRQNTRRTN